jgi:hypothetical protein
MGQEEKPQPLQPFKQLTHLTSREGFHLDPLFDILLCKGLLHQLIVLNILIILRRAEVDSAHWHRFWKECVD